MTTPSDISDLSTTAASNSPAGSETPSVLDDNIRALGAIIKQNVSKGADIASAGTITVPNVGSYFVVTGTTTITGINDTWNGRAVLLKFSGVLTLTHSASLILFGANITTAAGDTLFIVNESTGVWRAVAFTASTTGTYITASSSDTLTNKSVDLANNTLTGTLAQFNTALSDGSFASLNGGETLTNKTINYGSNTIVGTTANFNAALSDGSFATLAGSETLTNKTVSLASNTVTGTTAQFNTALSDGSFTTLAGTETLTNKTLTSPVLNTGVSGTAFLDEDDLSSDSATKLASQQSIKAYVDTLVAASGGAVKQIKIATSSPGSNLTASYADYETVALTSVASGSYVLVFANGNYDVNSGTSVQQIITDSSNVAVSFVSDLPYNGASTTQSTMSIGYDTTPGTGTVTYKLRAKESASTSIDDVIMVAVEYTP